MGRDEFEAVEFEGTIYVNANCTAYPMHSEHCDDDYLGVVFAFQVISWVGKNPTAQSERYISILQYFRKNSHFTKSSVLPDPEYQYFE